MTKPKLPKLKHANCEMCGAYFKPYAAGQLNCSGLCEMQYQNREANKRWVERPKEKKNNARALRWSNRDIIEQTVE